MAKSVVRNRDLKGNYAYSSGKIPRTIKRPAATWANNVRVASQVQIMACTSDDGAIGYLNAIDEKFGKARA